MQLSEALDHVEGLVQLMTAALEGKNGAPSPDTVADGMRNCMIAFSGLAQNFQREQFTPALIARMEVISQRIAQQREHLVRMGAMTEQQLQTLVPQQRDAHTYGSVASSAPQGNRASVSKLYHISG